MLAAVARRLGQPPVVGEILGGLVLGPACWPRCGRRIGLLLTPSVVGAVTVVGSWGWSRSCS